jgi:hypothetical protein
MRRILALAISTYLLLMTGSVLAQQNSRSGTVWPEVVSTSTRAVLLSGRISDDGRVIVSEDQDRWAVSNPKAVQGLGGQWVTVKCQLSSDQTSIHVLSIKSNQAGSVTRPADAAFRR